MPLRSDPSLWYNLPGVVAAFQSTMAPSPMHALINAAAGPAPTQAYASWMTWTRHRGWLSNPSKLSQIQTGVMPTANGSFIVRWSHLSGDWGDVFTGDDSANVVQRVRARPGTTLTFSWASNNTNITISDGASGVAGMSRGRGFYDGMLRSDRNDVWGGSTIDQDYRVSIGYKTCYIYSILVCNRPLSNAEMWQASRQMAYCDVNPDWSVWSPRRRYYYYAPTVAAFQAAWAERANRLIGGG